MIAATNFAILLMICHNGDMTDPPEVLFRLSSLEGAQAEVIRAI